MHLAPARSSSTVPRAAPALRYLVSSAISRKLCLAGACCAASASAAGRCLSAWTSFFQQGSQSVKRPASTIADCSSATNSQKSSDPMSAAPSSMCTARPLVRPGCKNGPVTFTKCRFKDRASKQAQDATRRANPRGFVPRTSTAQSVWRSGAGPFECPETRTRS